MNSRCSHTFTGPSRAGFPISSISGLGRVASSQRYHSIGPTSVWRLLHCRVNRQCTHQTRISNGKSDSRK